MNILKEKFKNIEKNLNNTKTALVNFDIDKSLYKSIRKKSKKYNISEEVYINFLLHEYLIKLEKDKEKKNFNNIIDNISFSKFLKNNIVKEKTLLLNYLNPNEKMIILPLTKINITSKYDLIIKYINSISIYKLDDIIDEFLFYNYQITTCVEDNKFKAIVIDPIDFKETEIYSKSLINNKLNNCYKELLNFLEFKN